MSRQFPAAPPAPSTPLMPVGNPSPPQTIVDRTSRWIERNQNLLILGTAVAVSAGAGYYLYNRSSVDSSAGGDGSAASSSKKNKKKNKKKSKFVGGEGTTGPLLEEIKPEEKKPEVKQENEFLSTVPQGDDLAKLSESERNTLGAQLKDQGNQLYSKKKFEQAVACYTKAIEVSVKRDAVFFSNRAACFTNYSPPEWTKVVDDCNEAIAIDKAYVKALRRRAGALEHLGRLEEASRDYTAIALIENLGDDQANDAVERAIKALAEKRLREIMENHEFKLPARSFIRQYLSAFRPHPKPSLPAEPSQGDRTLDLAFDALAASDYDHAFSFVNEAIEQGISTKEGQAEAHSLRGVFKFLSSDSIGARDEFEKSISIHPTSQAWTKLASVHMELGHLEPGEKAKAFGDYEAAIQLNPNDPDIYYQRGQINFVSEEWANAKEDYEKSTALDSDFIFSHIQAAVCQYKLENYSACFAAFRRILKQFPQRSEAFNYYGEILLEQGKFSEAVERFEQAADLEKDNNPPNVTPILNKAFTLVRWKQDIAGAEDLCRKAHELDPECDIPVVAMGQFASQQSKLDEAIEWFEKHLKLARAEPDLMQALQFLEAAKAQKAFVQGYPEHAAILSQQVRARAGL